VLDVTDLMAQGPRYNDAMQSVLGTGVFNSDGRSHFEYLQTRRILKFVLVLRGQVEVNVFSSIKMKCRTDSIAYAIDFTAR